MKSTLINYDKVANIYLENYTNHDLIISLFEILLNIYIN